MKRRAFIRASAGLMTAGAGAAVISACAGPALTAKAPRKIGYLSGNARSSVDVTSAPFKERLRELGYVDGRDISIEFRVADNANDRLPAFAEELVKMPVDVILAEAGPAQLAAKKATDTIPIVLVFSTDPIGQGLVASLARPGGNVTGVVTASYAIAGKQVEVLKETVPGLARLAVIGNATNLTMANLLPAVEEAARGMGVTIEAFAVRGPDELDVALTRIAGQRFDAVLMLPALSVVRANDQVPTFASRVGLPAMYSDMQFARAGGLMHMGVNFASLHRRAAEYVDKILRGARPMDLPIEQPTEFDLIVNLAAAQKLGLVIPDGVRRRATEILN
jgi:putative ABC transport system substrate-binding protein